MTALAALAEARGAGVELQVDAGRLRLNAKASPPAELLDRLRQHKAEVMELLTGARCRYCGGMIDWRTAGAVAFADGTAAHVACYEQAEVARLHAAARRALKGVVAVSDDGELLLRGEDLS
jgi:hypothetical protein